MYIYIYLFMYPSWFTLITEPQAPSKALKDAGNFQTQGLAKLFLQKDNKDHIYIYMYIYVTIPSAA